MIICTSKSAPVLSRALGKGQSSVIAIDKMLDQLHIDPAITSPKRDAYIITDEDIRATKIKLKFEQAVQNKHPNTKIIFLNKSKKPLYPNGLAGVDMFLTDVKIQNVSAAISSVIQDNQIHEVAESVSTRIEIIPEFDPRDVVAGTTVTEPETSSVQKTYVPELELNVPDVRPEEVVEELEPEIKRSPLAERIANTRSVADISMVARELTATNLIKELYESNSTYAGIEEKLKGINDTIRLVINDINIPSLDEKLSKIRALAHDKAFFSSKGDTIIEQRMEEIIDVLCSQTVSLLDGRLSEIDYAIKQIRAQKEVDAGNARLGGLNEERVNLILELRTMEAEIESIFKSTDNFIISTTGEIAARAKDITGSELYNAHLRSRGTILSSDETRAAVYAAMELSSNEVPDKFKEMKLKVVNMISLLGKLFDLDKEIIMAQQKVIEYFKANKIEDTITAETLIKKSLRVYVGYEGVGRTIIPYLLSAYKSRQNANVLLLDLTGIAKFDSYGIQTYEVEEFLVNQYQKEFCVVAGNVENSIPMAQRIITALLKAADYYRVINVVLRPDQRELFECLAADVLSVNYITDTNPRNIEKMSKYIESTKVENVGRRVIINKCDIPIKAIITKLGLDDAVDFQACVFPTLTAITDASLNSYNPYGTSAVTMHMEEMIKHA